MKKIILISGIVICIANLLFGLILTNYQFFNVGINSAVIIGTMLLLYFLWTSSLKDAYAISLSFLFFFLGLVEFILGCFAPQQFENNWYLLVIVIFLLFEVLMFLITKIKSNS